MSPKSTVPLPLMSSGQWNPSSQLNTSVPVPVDKRPIFETIATQGQGLVELLDGLFTG